MRAGFNLLTLIILVSLFSGNVISQNKLEPDNFIKDVQNFYSSLENFELNFNQIISTQVIQQSQTFKGRLLFSKENKYRLELDNQIIISDGISIYNYSKKAKRVVITNIEENIFSPQYILLHIPKFSKVIYKGEEDILNRKAFHFELLPIRSNPEYKKLNLWIDEEKIIWQIYIEDWAGNNYQFIVDNFKTNQKLSKELFTFKIPSGVRVVDLR